MKIKLYKGTEIRAFQMSMEINEYRTETPEEYLEKDYTVTRDENKLFSRMLDPEPEIVTIDGRFKTFYPYDKERNRRGEAEYHLSSVYRNEEGELTMTFSVAGVWTSGGHKPKFTVAELTKKFDEGHYIESRWYKPEEDE